MLHALSFRPKFDILPASNDFPSYICYRLCDRLRMDESCRYGTLLRIVIRIRLCFCRIVHRKRRLEIRFIIVQKRKYWETRKMQAYVWSFYRMSVCHDYDSGCLIWSIHWCCVHCTPLEGRHESTLGLFIVVKFGYIHPEDICHGNLFDANVWMLTGCKGGRFSPKICSKDPNF